MQYKRYGLFDYLYQFLLDDFCRKCLLLFYREKNHTVY